MRVIEKAPRLLRAAELPDRNISADKNDFLVGTTVGSENDISVAVINSIFFIIFILYTVNFQLGLMTVNIGY